MLSRKLRPLREYSQSAPRCQQRFPSRKLPFRLDWHHSVSYRRTHWDCSMLKADGHTVPNASPQSAGVGLSPFCASGADCLSGVQRSCGRWFFPCRWQHIARGVSFFWRDDDVRVTIFLADFGLRLRSLRSRSSAMAGSRAITEFPSPREPWLPGVCLLDATPQLILAGFRRTLGNHKLPGHAVHVEFHGCFVGERYDHRVILGGPHSVRSQGAFCA
jgi:hypothetical protein